MSENTYVIIRDTAGNPQFMMEASGDRIVIEEDKFRTGYECRTCDGERWSTESCPSCLGTGRIAGEQICRPCEGTGKKACPTCDGKGGSIIVPENAIKKTTSGIIRSVGKYANFDNAGNLIVDSEGKPWLKVGDRVMFALFAGIAIEFKQRGSCRILHQNEVMAKLYGTANLGKELKQ